MKKIFGISTGSLIHTCRAAALGIGISILALFLAAMPLSCSFSETGIELTKSQVTPPVILSLKAVAGNAIQLTCDEAFTLSGTEISQSGRAVFSENQCSCTYEGNSAKISFANPVETGARYEIHGRIFDEDGNSVDFSYPFTGYNDHPARLLLSEIRAANKKPREEFVEVYVLKSGNTGGLEILSGNYGEKKKYSFPSIEVQAGEYITVHMRVAEGEEEISIDETADNFSLSTGSDSNPQARDLYFSGDTKRIAQSDVILIRNSQDSNLMDALLYSEDVKSSSNWKDKTNLTDFSKAANSAGIWGGGASPKDAVDSSKLTTATRSLSRQNIAEIAEKYSATEIPPVIQTCKKDWLLVGKNRADCTTPGSENSSTAL